MQTTAAAVSNKARSTVDSTRTVDRHSAASQRDELVSQGIASTVVRTLANPEGVSDHRAEPTRAAFDDFHDNGAWNVVARIQRNIVIGEMNMFMDQSALSRAICSSIYLIRT